jgi:MoxR-like ATPase
MLAMLEMPALIFMIAGQVPQLSNLWSAIMHKTTGSERTVSARPALLRAKTSSTGPEPSLVWHLYPPSPHVVNPTASARPRSKSPHPRTCVRYGLQQAIGTTGMPNDSELHDWRARALRIEDEVGKAIIGQRETVRMINVAVFARGHVLLEGDVGIGKTTILRAFSRAIGGDFERVEGTVDLMPGDLIYHTYVDAEGKPRIEPGPLLRHGERLVTFFFNEVNRARPQVQSLLLRAMAERTVSAFNREFRFPHMTVFADRNRVEKEETFELASAARDRFLLEVRMPMPADTDVRRALVFDPQFHDVEQLMQNVAPGVVPWQDLNAIAAQIQRGITASPALERYALDLWDATQSPQKFGIQLDGVDMDQLILAGASPRGMMALIRAARVVAWLAGRTYLTPDDMQSILPAALGHRIFFTPVYELRRAEIADALIAQIMQKIATPR